MNTGDTAWMLASAALVLLMTPGLAFFYGGMVRSKSVLNMLMMNFATIGIVSVLWVLFGFSMAFSTKDVGGGLLGNFDWAGMKNTLEATWGQGSDKMPLMAFSSFQLMFAIITPALISGAVADRVKFGSWCAFVAIWATVIYFPVAHWVWALNAAGGPLGWLAKEGVLDFAGGTAVHLNAGMAGLAFALVLGKRVGWRKDPMRPHNIPFVLLGAGLLWFGWFGFNAGSAGAANALSATAFMNTQVATAAAALAWIIVEKLRDGKSTTLGVASGAVAGLVAITPACGFVNPLGAVIIGLIAGAVCAFAVGLKYKLGFDDALDVVGVHAVGGALGALLIGFFATKTVNGAGANGLFEGGGIAQLGKQALGVVVVGAFSFIGTWIIAMILDKTIGLRASEEDEVTGLDLTQHAETAYDMSVVHTGSPLLVSAGVAAAPAGGKAAALDNDEAGDVKAADEESAAEAR
jgi:Amt family ammonium transporter